MRPSARWTGPALVVGSVLFLASCQTYAVATEAPVEFWLTLEELVAAVLLDLWSVVDLFL